MDSDRRVYVTPPFIQGRQLELVQFEQNESTLQIVGDSEMVLFSPRFYGHLRVGSKILESNFEDSLGVKVGPNVPLIIDSLSAHTTWWTIQLIGGVSGESTVKSMEIVSLYRISAATNLMLPNLIEQLTAGTLTSESFETFWNELPVHLEVCDDLPAVGNRKLAERLRTKILEGNDKQVNLREMAEELSCHPSQLSREFRRMFGLAPYKFSFLLRLSTTKCWLRKGRDLADVATNFEFSDQSHFTRAFRQVYQMTPNFYRNLYKNWWERN